MPSDAPKTAPEVVQSALAFPHARELERLLRRHRAGKRAFTPCVGASESVRARVESALGERLGGIASAYIAPETYDPWQVILDARRSPSQVVSVRLDDAVEDRILRLLDVRRELLVGESVSLLLWLSLGAMDRVASLCSNLWSYREDVAWFLSHEDIEASTEVALEEIPAERPLDEQLAALEERIVGQRTKPTALLIEKARLLDRLERFQEAHALLDHLVPEVRQGSADENSWREVMLHVLGSQGRAQALYDFAESGRVSNAPRHRVIERVIAALICTDWKSAFSMLEQAAGSTYRWDIAATEGGFGAACAEAARQLMPLGRLAAAERWTEEAQKAVRQRVSDWWPMVNAYSAKVRSAIAWERLDAIAALQFRQRTVRIGQRVGALDVLTEGLKAIEQGYAAMGLADDRRVFRERHRQTREQMHPDAKLDATLEAPPDRPFDTPFARLERAVHDAEHALNDSPAHDPSAHLDACAAAWEDEDPRYRSLCLFDRWQRCLARHLLSRGEEARAVETLQHAAEELRDLPRTRLGTLLALARLATSDAFLPAREAAAMEVLALALPVTSGALAEERDARRALASIARARGANHEADAQEAEAARIDLALA